MPESAPKTKDLIKQVNVILKRRKITREQFRIELNQILPPARRIKPNSLSSVFRWLNLDLKDWQEPLGEIALAFKEFVESN